VVAATVLLSKGGMNPERSLGPPDCPKPQGAVTIVR
jgi:hypothetical protein